MPANTESNGTKPKRETWADWLPPGSDEPLDALTRDELIERLRRRGVDVSARTLAYWESVGALPHAIRRWRDGAPRALYPERAVDLAAQVRMTQWEGLALSEIGRLLRRQARRPRPGTILPDGSTYGGTVRPLGRKPPAAVYAALDFFARRYEGATGGRVSHIEIRIVGDRGTDEIRFDYTHDEDLVVATAPSE